MSCISLTSIVIPDKITKIDSKAFFDCVGLESVIIGKGVKTIESSAFEYCTSLINVFYKGTSEEWKHISVEYFNDSLKNANRYYYIENGNNAPTDGGNYWYFDAEGNAKIWGTHDYSVMNYNDAQHWYECECGVVDSSTIESHFGGTATCKELAKCTICEQSYGDLGKHSIVDDECVLCGFKYNDTFEYELSEDLTYYIVTGIGDYNDEDLYIPLKHDGLPVKEIASQAFAYCNSFKHAIIGASVTTIGDVAFFGCEGLIDVTIGEGVATIGERVFVGCPSLVNIEVDSNNAAYASIDGNLYDKDCKTLVQYAPGKVDSEFVIPESVERIGDYSIYYCHGVGSVVIGKNVSL